MPRVKLGRDPRRLRLPSPSCEISGILVWNGGRAAARVEKERERARKRDRERERERERERQRETETGTEREPERERERERQTERAKRGYSRGPLTHLQFVMLSTSVSRKYFSGVAPRENEFIPFEKRDNVTFLPDISCLYRPQLKCEN